MSVNKIMLYYCHKLPINVVFVSPQFNFNLTILPAVVINYAVLLPQITN